MNKITKFSVGSIKSSEVSIPTELKLTEKPNINLIGQAWRVYFDSGHIGNHRTLTRSEISRTTKKWYKQKGTGGARHGARSAPIFVGGSKAHGPKGIKRALSLPEKMSKSALKQTLSMRMAKNEIVLAEGIEKIKQTKVANELIKNISEKGIVCIVLADKNSIAKRYFRNIKGVEVINYKSLNMSDVLKAGVVIFDSEIFTKSVKVVREKKK